MNRFAIVITFCRSVLDQLRSLWEQNIYNTGVLGKKEDRIVKQEAAEAPEGCVSSHCSIAHRLQRLFP